MASKSNTSTENQNTCESNPTLRTVSLWPALRGRDRDSPMRERRHTRVEVRRAQPVRYQIAQKRSYRRDALFAGCPTTGLAYLLNKLPQIPSLKPARVISDAPQQRTQVRAIVGKSRLTGAPTLPHPLAEQSQNRGIFRDIRETWQRNFNTRETADKQTSTHLHTAPMFVAETLAAASIEMSGELVHSIFVEG